MHDLQTIQRMNAEATEKVAGRKITTVGIEELEKIVNWFVAELSGEESGWVTIESIETGNTGKLLQLKASIEPAYVDDSPYEVTLDLGDL